MCASQVSITVHYKTSQCITAHQKTPQGITRHLTVHYKTSQHTTAQYNTVQDTNSVKGDLRGVHLAACYENEYGRNGDAKCENGYGLDAMETHVSPEYAPDGYGVEMRIHVNQPEPPAHTGSEPESERTHGSREKCDKKSKVPRQGDSSNIP